MIKIILISLLSFSFMVSDSNPKEEIDAFWAKASRTVEEGDYEGYANTFHPDAILVNGMSESSYPISQALAGWKQGFDDTKTGKMTASVEFRFSERLHSETTAHETGIFNYSWQNEGEEKQNVLIHFQALLTKVSGEWKLMMEYQVSEATKEEWENLE